MPSETITCSSLTLNSFAISRSISFAFNSIVCFIILPQ
nr:MAG TPA: hypothetical protein [Caudoviricetes sp.]